MTSKPEMNMPLKGISSMATKSLLTSLAARYERETGRRVELVAVGGVDAARRVREGEDFDFAVLAGNVIERMAAEGHIVADMQAVVAMSSIAVAVPAGVAHPDISSEAAVREAMQQAASIGYSTGPSGDHLLRLIERWGLTETLRPRLVQAPAGQPVGALVAQGKVDIGFQQLGELIEVPGISIIGLMPEGAQSVTPFTAAVCMTSEQKQAAREFLAFMASDEVNGLKREHGMEPA